jgi:hypothetical protein
MPLPQYKNIVGPADTIMQDVNHLAAEGWLVHSFQCCGATEAQEPETKELVEVPVLAYLMWKDEAPTVTETGRPIRKVLGRP